MKKINLTVFISIFVCLLFSCSHGFLKDPRLYNARMGAKDTTITVAPEPELQLTGGVDPFDDVDKWYNNPNSNGDELNPDKLDFPHTDFQTMSLVGTYFNDSNVPVYAMKQENVWVSKNTSKSEFIHAGAPTTKGQGYDITNVNWYQYRERNPLYAADGSYNNSLQVTANGNPKLNRFYFYRFTGETLSPSLDNFLFAIDTYSKLMFAFAKPTASKSVFGNNVPTAWGPTDNEPYKDGTVYQFYMYDPVGYVEKAGSEYNVVLYEWFSNNLAKGIYDPTMGEAGNDFASKKPDGAGKSPFNNHTIDNFLINMKLFAGRTFMEREKTPSGGNGLKKYIYVISEDGTTLTKKTEVWNGLEDAPADVVYTIRQDENSTATKGILSGGDNAFSGFEVTDEGKTIVFNNGVTASTKFQDYGPDFIERVKHNPVYTNGNISYTFSEGGKKLTYISAENKTYKYEFIQQESDTERYKGVYWTDDAIASWMGIGYGGVALYDADFRIKVTNTSAGGAGLVDWLIMKDEAFLEQEAKTTFIDNVKNRSFSLREKNDDGFDVNLLTYSFDSNGNATFTRTPWQKNGESSTYTVTNGSGQKFGFINGKDAILDTTGTNWTLSIGGKVYTQGYIDNGPSFLNRVKGSVWQTGKTKYVFSDDGRTLTLDYEKFGTISSFPWVGYYIETKNYTYDQGSDKDNVIATYGGYRVHLYSNDSVVKRATVSGVGDASIMAYEAARVK